MDCRRYFCCLLLGALACRALLVGPAKGSEPPALRTHTSTTADAPPDAWTQFRGPEGQGHATGTGLPVRWNEKKNVTWKVPIRGTGWSSPVIVNDVIWLTTAIVPENSLRVLCLDANTGQVLRDIEVFHKETLGSIHPKNSHATPTPLLVDERCFVHFGSHGTAALNFAGEILWKTEIKYYHHHGPGSSPVFFEKSLFITCDGLFGPYYDDRKIEGAGDPQFVVSLDADTGKELWRIRRDGAHSYSTPLTIEVDGIHQIVAPGGKRVVAYDPSTRDEIWSYSHSGYSVVPRPVFGHGLVYFCTGYDVPTLVALRPNGHGDVTDSHVAWKSNQAVPFNPSPLLVGDELYTVSDQGVLSCYDAKTGKSHWRRRLGGNHSSSPIFADGKLYIIDEMGTTTVISPGVKYKVLSKNVLRGKALASLAVYGQALFLRTEGHLYRIEDPNPKGTDSPESEVKDKDESGNESAESK